jgi:hypothetical protein
VRESASEEPRYDGTRSALAVAVLVELAGRGRLARGEDGRWRPVQGPSLGDPTLDTVMSLLGGQERDAADLARMFTAGLHERLPERLAERGILGTPTRKFLSFPARHVWRVTTTTRREELRAWLWAVLLGHQQPDQWSAALIALLHALGALGEVAADRTAAARAKEVAESDWPADAVAVDFLGPDLLKEVRMDLLLEALPI